MPTAILLFSIVYLVVLGFIYLIGKEAVLGVAIVLGLIGLAFGGMAGVLALILAWTVLAIVCSIVDARRRKFFAWTTGIGLVLFAAWIASYVPRMQEVVELRREYPVESLRDRLAYESKTNVGRASAENSGSTEEPGNGSQFAVHVSRADIESHLVDVEDQLDQNPSRSYRRSRQRSLAKLYEAHQENVAEFVANEGFGISRGPRIRADRRYIEIPGPPVIQQPAESREIEPSPGTATPPGLVTAPAPRVLPPTEKLLETLHTNGIVDFASPERSGYAKDVDHVVGFLPHAFSAVPQLDPDKTIETRWKIDRLELVSLLKHDSPMVYDSDSLPNMKEIDNVKTRNVDAFESSAIEKLRGGEDLVVDESKSEIRMLGSLRAARQCVQCHNANRGDLLGAFTYRIVRDTPGDAPNGLQNPLPAF